MGTTLGTDAGSVPPDPQITFNRGRFVISRHGTSDIGVHSSYTLDGHTVSRGFAGTARYTQSWVQAAQHIRCDSGTLAWKARPSRQTFP